jgi:hypothetical protein
MSDASEEKVANIVHMKTWGQQKLRKESALRQVLLSQPDHLDVRDLLAKMPDWLTLAELEG